MAGFRRTSVGAARRVDFRGRGPYVPQVAHNFTSSNYWDALAAAGLDGNSSMTWGVIFQKSIAGNITVELTSAGKFTSNTRGYRGLIRDGSNGRLLAGVVNSTPTNVTEQNTVTLAQNQLHRYVWTYDGTTLSGYLDGSLMSAGTVSSGYTANTVDNFVLGQTTAVSSDEVEIRAVVYAEGTALNSTQVATWDTQVTGGVSSHTDLLFPTGTTNLWDAADAAVTWPDKVGSVDLTQQGSPSVKANTDVWAP